ncbi:cupin domain-containing protein [Streptomyces sp. NPDC021080]|uniref:cupin domain-containing protein n=1 Tax=Streptomyces sp. NPDC021080 TaxID=3365110 RepID=UPI003795953B
MTEEAKTGEPQTHPALSVVGPGDGETIVLGTTHMRVLEDGSHTGHRLAITESVLAPHTQGPPQHRHTRHDEGFYILSGTIRFTAGDKDHDAGTRRGGPFREPCRTRAAPAGGLRPQGGHRLQPRVAPRPDR